MRRRLEVTTGSTVALIGAGGGGSKQLALNCRLVAFVPDVYRIAPAPGRQRRHLEPRLRTGPPQFLTAARRIEPSVIRPSGRE